MKLGGGRNGVVRLGVAVLAGLVFCGGASAGSWQEYVYADYGFAISFPDAPKIQGGRFPLPDGSQVPARIYSVTQPDGDYRVVIADFANRPESENTIIDTAEAGLKRNGEV